MYLIGIIRGMDMLLNFQREAHLRKNVYFWKDENGKVLWKDTYIYAKLNDEQ